MKKVLLLVLLVLIGAGYYLFTNLEGIVKKVVHKYGSEVTGTSVDLEGFDLSLKNGEGKIKRITVANPSGYSTPYIFELGEITVKVDIKSLTTDKIVIEKVEVKKPVITYEMLSLVKNNITDIQNNVNNFSKKSAKTEETKAVKTEDNGGSSKKVVIKSITVADGQLNAVTKIQEKTNNVSVNLPPISIKNIGEGKGGASVVTAITEVIDQILKTATQTVVNSKISDFKGIAQENMDGAVNTVKERLKGTGLFGN